MASGPGHFCVPEMTGGPRTVVRSAPRARFWRRHPSSSPVTSLSPSSPVCRAGTPRCELPWRPHALARTPIVLPGARGAGVKGVGASSGSGCRASCKDGPQGGPVAEASPAARRQGSCFLVLPGRSLSEAPCAGRYRDVPGSGQHGGRMDAHGAAPGDRGPAAFSPDTSSPWWSCLHHSHGGFSPALTF